MKPATYELANAFPRIFNVHIVNVMDRLSGILVQSIRRIASLGARHGGEPHPWLRDQETCWPAELRS
jgi:hypothetical protein